ncbi:YqzL family protein [Bacillus sp. CGMCC 1.16541]|nr:YqzL family protein [Bacillus sp. CGMCC 1.16541]
MLDFTWKVFSNTGNVDTYLLFKEIEQEGFETPEAYINEEIQNLDLPIS